MDVDKEDEKHLQIGAYLKVWSIIVLLVTLSYGIFLLAVEPVWLRRFLFTAIALIQAVLGVRYFMQMRLERPSLVYAIVLPVTLLLALVIFALSEGKYVLGVRQAEYSAQVSGQPVKESSQGQPQGETVGTQTGDLVELGKQLWQSRGCMGCHTITGKEAYGPTWKGLYGSQRELSDGSTTTADDVYLQESIVDPSAKVVKGFPAMLGMGQFTSQELQAIIAFLKSLSEEQ